MEENWKKWIIEQIADSGMRVESIPLSKIKGWGMQDDENFGRPDKKFFSYIGVRITMSKEQREVASWDQPITKEFGDGVVVVIVDEQDRFLVQTKLEPGNNPQNGYVMLNAPLSASLSNLTTAHGGNRPPRAELLDEEGVELIKVPQDGGKYINKTNMYGFVKVECSSLKIGQNERWFTKNELREAFKEGFLSEHLIQAIFTYIF